LARIVCVADGDRGVEVVLVQRGRGVRSVFLVEMFPGVVGRFVVIYGVRCWPDVLRRFGVTEFFGSWRIACQWVPCWITLLEGYLFGIFGVASGYSVDDLVFILRRFRWWVACSGGSLVVGYLASAAFIQARLGDRLGLMASVALCGLGLYGGLVLVVDLAG